MIEKMIKKNRPYFSQSKTYSSITIPQELAKSISF